MRNGDEHMRRNGGNREDKRKSQYHKREWGNVSEVHGVEGNVQTLKDGTPKSRTCFQFLSVSVCEDSHFLSERLIFLDERGLGT